MSISDRKQIILLAFCCPPTPLGVNSPGHAQTALHYRHLEISSAIFQLKA